MQKEKIINFMYGTKSLKHKNCAVLGLKHRTFTVCIIHQLGMSGGGGGLVVANHPGGGGKF